jgi:hypothetical protein
MGFSKTLGKGRGSANEFLLRPEMGDIELVTWLKLSIIWEFVVCIAPEDICSRLAVIFVRLFLQLIKWGVGPEQQRVATLYAPGLVASAWPEEHALQCALRPCTCHSQGNVRA